MASLKPFQVQKPGRLFFRIQLSRGSNIYISLSKKRFLLQNVEIGRLIFTFDPLCWERIIKIYPHYLHFQRNYTSSSEWRNKAGSFSVSIPLSHNKGRWRKVRFLQKLFTFFLCPYYHASILKSKRKKICNTSQNVVKYTKTFLFIQCAFKNGYLVPCLKIKNLFKEKNI